MSRIDFSKYIEKIKLRIKPQPSLPTARPLILIAGLAIVFLLATVVLGFALTRKTITLVDGGKEVIVKTRAANVADLLEKQKVILSPGDKVEPDLSEKISNGSWVVVKRMHSIALVMNQEKIVFQSVADTVGDVLKERQIALNDEDIVQPAVGEKINGDTEIRVILVQSEKEVKSVDIPYASRKISNPDLPKGISSTIIKGKNGKELQTWMVTYHDNQEVGRLLVDQRTVTNPTEGVIHVGTGQTVSRGGQTIRFKNAMDVVATAYSYTGQNTASGTYPKYGTVAVDPRVIPFGTRMFIEGYGYATALDKGGSIKGNRIDVFLESQTEARRWGVRKVKIYILD